MALKLKGVAAAPGIAIAPMVRFHSDMDYVPTRTVDEAGVEVEADRISEAIQSASRSILFLRHELADSISAHETGIYDAQLAFLHDPTLVADIRALIANQKVNAEVALQQVVARYEQVFEGMEDALMRERAADVRDIGRQVMAALMAKERSVYISEGQDYVFAAEEFLPSDAGVVDREHLCGIVTARGGKYTHGAILARSLGIPAIAAVEAVLTKIESGTLVILDGDAGRLIAEPDEEQLETYRRRKDELEETERRVFEVRFLPPRTSDGIEVSLMANVEGSRDLGDIEENLVSGIGLFRTEFAFMERRQFPTEEEQVSMYERAIEWAGDKPVTFRTLDIGGDKPLMYFRTPEERNPVLGWRGLRISLDWPDLLYTQIRSILRASAGGHARILLPMVTSVSEVERCRTVLDEILADMKQSGEPHDENIEIGTMVEVPAIVPVLEHVLPMVDFISVGTNDLVQYLLAVDRDNPRVAGLYNPYHPAVLRVLKQIAEAASAAGKPASICGEIAGDHYFTPLLLGLGFRELSMAPVFLPRVKLIARALSIKECEGLAEEALKMSSAKAIRDLARGAANRIWDEFLRDGGGPEDSASDGDSSAPAKKGKSRSKKKGKPGGSTDSEGGA